MGAPKLTPEDLASITQLAKGWGKIVCRHAFGDQGPGLDVDLAQMEQLAFAAAQGLLAGALEAATRRQADQLGDSQPCPQCGRACPLTGHQRTVEVRGGRFEHREPVGHCPTCRRDFFPPAAPAAPR
jgi:hypothetical protein